MKDRKYDLWFWSIIGRYLLAIIGSLLMIKSAIIGDLTDDLALQLFPWLWLWLVIVFIYPSLKKSHAAFNEATKNRKIKRRLERMSQTQRDWWIRKINEDNDNIKRLLDEED
jgi:hypothetical protein